ncbi:MAG: hypothetical protein EXS31_09605 [Pedosphaera sp.]|nr:hypothetical protein [Pedosphaera sp.]
MKTRILCFIVLVLFCTASSQAAVRRLCLVSYEKQIGYSDEVKVEVNFVTGKELNKATKSFDYDSFENYALVWFKEGEVAILKIDEIVLGVGAEFTNEDFKKLFRIMGECDAVQVKRKSPRKWKLKGKDFLRWVDPRVEK